MSNEYVKIKIKKEVEAWKAVQAKVTVVARVSLVSEMSISLPIMRSVVCRM